MWHPRGVNGLHLGGVFFAQRADLRTLSVVNSPKISRGPSCDQVMEINFHLLIFPHT